MLKKKLQQGYRILLILNQKFLLLSTFLVKNFQIYGFILFFLSYLRFFLIFSVFIHYCFLYLFNFIYFQNWFIMFYLFIGGLLIYSFIYYFYEE
jgi:hypothetical protein